MDAPYPASSPGALRAIPCNSCGNCCAYGISAREPVANLPRWMSTC